MSFFAVLLALVIEQLKPLPRDNWVHERVVAWVGWVGRNFDAGRERHAWVVWIITVVVPAAVACAVYLWLASMSLIVALAFNVSILFLTLGFRQFSHYFTDIRQALEQGDEDHARHLLAEWRHLDASELPRTEVLRHVIEHALLAAHRHVLGVFFWFVVLSALGLGPAGAVLYRLADFVSRYWRHKAHAIDAPSHERLRALSQRLFTGIDHVPARLTAFGFAVVGNFEEAVNGWRRDAELWRHDNEGVLLAAAAGAVGVQLGGRAAPRVDPPPAGDFGAGDAPPLPDALGAAGSTPGMAPRVGHLHSVVGLVWRSVVLWMLLVALLTLANVLA